MCRCPCDSCRFLLFLCYKIRLSYYAKTPKASSEDLRNYGVAKKLMQKLDMPMANLEHCESDYNIALFPYYICAGGVKGN